MLSMPGLKSVLFLRDFKLSKIKNVKGKVAVIGGGNAAIDSARTALRLGAEKVEIFYRRSREEMPAMEEEIEDAIDEGVNINYLTSPVEISGKKGRVKTIRLIKNELGEPDASGRNLEAIGANSEVTIIVPLSG